MFNLLFASVGPFRKLEAYATTKSTARELGGDFLAGKFSSHSVSQLLKPCSCRWATAACTRPAVSPRHRSRGGRRRRADPKDAGADAAVRHPARAARRGAAVQPALVDALSAAAWARAPGIGLLDDLFALALDSPRETAWPVA